MDTVTAGLLGAIIGGVAGVGGNYVAQIVQNQREHKE